MIKSERDIDKFFNFFQGSSPGWVVFFFFSHTVKELVRTEKKNYFFHLITMYDRKVKKIDFFKLLQM